MSYSISNNIVFCIWLYNSSSSNSSTCIDRYLIRMNSVFTSLYNDNKQLSFIIYTNNPFAIYKGIHGYELMFIKHHCCVVNTSIIFDKYYEYTNDAIRLYKSSIDTMINNNTIYPNRCSGSSGSSSIRFDDAGFRLRHCYRSWAMLFTSYVRRLVHNGIFHARVSLNLRLIALSMHGIVNITITIITITIIISIIIIIRWSIS